MCAAHKRPKRRASTHLVGTLPPSSPLCVLPHCAPPSPPPHPTPRLQGCSARCCFCCNPDTWDIQGGTLTTPQQLAARIARLAPYLRPNGGGVTVSGGEPLLQPDFVAELFRLCHDMGLTTCLDTTGQAATSLEGGGMKVAWDTVLPHTDVVLLCVKHLDAGGQAAGSCGSFTQPAAARRVVLLHHVQC